VKRYSMHVAVGILGAALAVGNGCEWSGGGSGGDFNTSRGAGVNINWSGVYNGLLAGGLAVERTSAGSIRRLVISQAGNSIEVVDNQGSHYRGSVGSPGAVSRPQSDGTYPPGARLVESQITFSGKDEVSAKDISFVGILHAVSVDEIRGTTDDRSQTDSRDDTRGREETTVANDGTNTVITTIRTVGTPADDFYRVTTTVVTIDNKTNKEISRVVTTTSNSERVQTSQATFTLTEQNTQYRLEGTWIEDGGVASGVDALSRGNASTITTVTTE
jgi:hypothetical protein